MVVIYKYSTFQTLKNRRKQCLNELDRFLWSEMQHWKWDNNNQTLIRKWARCRQTCDGDNQTNNGNNRINTYLSCHQDRERHKIYHKPELSSRQNYIYLNHKPETLSRQKNIYIYKSKPLMSWRQKDIYKSQTWFAVKIDGEYIHIYPKPELPSRQKDTYKIKNLINQ